MIGRGGFDMFCTIAVGTCVLIQGLFVARRPGGLVEITVDGRSYVGRPVERRAPMTATI
jgi:hypothetical protein